METWHAGGGLPRVIAHRGASADCPENTLAAFGEALEQGCDGIELDVQLSRDGVPVVYHDRTLRKAGAGRKRVSELDAVEIGRLDAGSWFDRRFRGERIPTLEQVLRRYGDRTRLLVELKVRDRDRSDRMHLRLAEAVARALRSLPADVLLLSFDLETLETAARALAGTGIGTALNVRTPRRVTPALRARIDRLTALSFDVRTLSSRTVGAVQRTGRPVFVFTCNTPRTATRALDSGADAIMSDRPAWLQQFLEGRRGGPA